MDQTRPGGIALVLVSGILAILALLVLAFAGIARMGAASGAAISSGAQSRLAAEAGMEYAAARLRLEGYPRVGTDPLRKTRRGDDWAFRDPPGTALECGINLSYAHGENWIDDGDGIRQVGEPLRGDRDGDGRFSAWSGRLRGTGAGDPRFSLKIESPEGKIPVNGGVLVDKGYGWPDIPDNQDTGISLHTSLTHILNNLGVIAGLKTRRRDVPIPPAGNPAEPIQCSWLGSDLMENRPIHGYRGWAEVEAVLARLGYSKEEIEAIKPHVDLTVSVPLTEYSRETLVGGGDDDLGGGDDDGGDGDGGEEKAIGERLVPYVPVCLATASVEVLQSLWAYVGFYNDGKRPFPDAGGREAESRRAGLDKLGQPVRYNDLFMMIYPDEARNLAKQVLSWRDEGLSGLGDYSWRSLYGRLLDCAVTDDPDRRLFPVDLEDISKVNGGAGDPLYSRLWMQAKVDLAMRAVLLDPLPSWPAVPAWSASWRSWGIDRSKIGPWDGIQTDALLATEQMRLVTYPADPGSDYTGNPHKGSGGLPVGSCCQGIGLEPPSRYTVASLGKTGDRKSGGGVKREGEFTVNERAHFASQEAFELLEGGTDLARRGITVLGKPNLTGVVTLPYFDISSGATFADVRYTRGSGAIGLATRPLGLAPPGLAGKGADLYWPFDPDGDGVARNHYDCVRGGDYPMDPPHDPPPYPAVQVYGGAYGANVRTGRKLRFDCPGILGGMGEMIKELSLECWMCKGGRIRIEKNGPPGKPDSYIVLDLADSPPDTGEFASQVKFGMAWGVVNSKTGAITQPGVNAKWIVPDHRGDLIDNDRDGAVDDDPDEINNPLSAYHVVLVLQPGKDAGEDGEGMAWEDGEGVAWVAGPGDPPKWGEGLGDKEAQEALEFVVYINGSRFNRDVASNANKKEEMKVTLSYDLDQALPPGGAPEMAERLYLTGVDDLRIYPRALNPDEVKALCRNGHFCPPPPPPPGVPDFKKYKSPRFRFDTAVRPRWIQWNGIAPSWLYPKEDPNNPAETRPAEGPPISPGALIRLELRLYDAYGSQLPGSPLTVKEGVPVDLSAFPRAAGFSYLVHFNECAPVVGGMQDTPIFESMHLIYERGGGWTRYE